jgi:hypothetical protein
MAECRWGRETKLGRAARKARTEAVFAEGSDGDWGSGSNMEERMAV